MIKFKTQNDLVREAIAEEEELILTDRLRLPGIEQFHLLPEEELRESLKNLLKARSKVEKLTWKFTKITKVFEIKNKTWDKIVDEIVYVFQTDSVLSESVGQYVDITYLK
jgi:hypothetical protein